MRNSAKTVALVGGFDAAHIAASFKRASGQLGIICREFDVAEAWSGNRLVRALRWRFADRRPPRLTEFSAKVVGECVEKRVDAVVATGAVPLTPHALSELRKLGIQSMNYSTDDPWNPRSRSRWFLRALPCYDTVFTPRYANIDELQRLGCGDVRYLPFGYDEMLHAPLEDHAGVPSYDVLFVGGADRDRADFVSTFTRSGPEVALVGGYWHQYRTPNATWLGCKTPQEIRSLTAAAKVNLCLLRRANRDDNVMRTFEIGAIGGGCLLVEDSVTHRQVFGRDGEAVIYFRSPLEAADRARHLLTDPAERTRLAATARCRITRGGHSYRERLETIIFGSQRPLRPDATILL